MTQRLPAGANLVWQMEAVSQQQHTERAGHGAVVVWLTGLPGSGKSTLARAAQHSLHAAGYRTALLDGDNLRQGLCADLGFSVADRNENVRRTAELAKLLWGLGHIVLVALVSPMREARDAARALVPPDAFLEVYCECALTTCRARDPKGHYARADRGQIADFTGVSSPYEPPLMADVTLDTGAQALEESVERLLACVLSSPMLRVSERRVKPL